MVMEGKRARIFKFISIALLAVLAAAFFVKATLQVYKQPADYTFLRTEEFVRTQESAETEYEDETVCRVDYSDKSGEIICSVNYSFEEWEKLPADASVTAYIYTSEEGTLAFPRAADDDMIKTAVREKNAAAASPVFGAAAALALLALGFVVISVRKNFFTAYEQIWFISILAAAAAVSVLFPEEEVNGINGLIIMALYLADTFLNILCELLISKQSKWNFIVSVFVEITEIVICIVLSYRFATLASTLFFWLPCDIISFINWHRHPDKAQDELTQVRTLRGWQEVLIVAGIIVWTAGVGYFLTTLDFGTTLFGGNRTLEVIVCFLDACASAVGIVNGVFILLRLREQWIAWYICAALEAVINILSGQYVLLVLKVGYLTNTTYGYVKWTKYIASRTQTPYSAQTKKEKTT